MTAPCCIMLHNIIHQLFVLPRIAYIDTTAEHGNGLSARFNRRTIGGSINANRHTRHDNDAALGKVAREMPRRLLAVSGTLPRADNGDRHSVCKIRQGAAHIQHKRRIRNLAQQLRISFIFQCHDLNVLLPARLLDVLRDRQIFFHQRIHFYLVEPRNVLKLLLLRTPNRFRRAESLEQMPAKSRAASRPRCQPQPIDPIRHQPSDLSAHLIHDN